MSEQTTERPTSAELKRQIEEATRAEKVKTDLKESALPLTGMMANEINVNKTVPETPSQNEPKPDPETPAAKGVEDPKTTSNVDLKEWAKKRGIDWTTEDSVLSALRKSDQAFHERRAKDKERETLNRPQAPYQPPAYQPPYQPQPAYVPQAPNNRAVIENIARQYNMTPEDVERLAAFNRDFFEAAARTERERTQREFDSIRIENQKNSVFRELSSDPVFRQPEVAVEYHRVLDEMQAGDPQSFEQNPTAYKRAFEIALSNIGRRNLEGRTSQDSVPSNSFSPPTTPPRPLGKGSGGGAYENENAIDPAAFARLSTKDQRAMLDKMGLVKPAY